MKNIKKIAIITSVLFLAQSAFAATTPTASTGATTWTWVTTTLDAPAAPKLVSKTSTWVTLSWDKAPAATGYIVYYSKTSVASTPADSWAKYPGQTDQIPATSTWTVVSGLEANTPYYFSLVTLDQAGDESNFSDELVVSTDANGAVASTGAVVATAATGAVVASWTTADFRLKNVTPVDTKTVSVEFSQAVWAEPITVKITKDSNASELVVASVTADPQSPTKVIVSLTSPLEISTAYTLVVITAKDSAWNDIKAWVDGTLPFVTDANLTVAPDLNAAWTWSTWTGTVTPNLEAAKTGPATNLIVFAALLLSFGLVYFYRRKLIK